MFFRFTSEVSGLAAHLGKGDALEFCFDRPRVVSVRLSKSYPDGLKPHVPSDAVCTSTSTADPADAKIAAELKAGWVVPVVEGKVKEDDATLQFVGSVLADLRALMMSTVGLFRWRHGIAEGPPDPCHTLKACYSEDGKVWREVFLVRGVRIRFGMNYWSTLDDDICKQVVELATAGMEEPLGRQLFREA
jgi:hypothetical protein